MVVLIVVFVAFVAVVAVVALPVKVVAVIFCTDTFVNDALNTFINALDGIEKLLVTERFVKLIFELMVPYGKPFMFVTDKLLIEAFDVLIN